MIIQKSREEIELMRESALIVSKTLGMIASEIKPGVTTLYLDKRAEEFIRDHGFTQERLAQIFAPVIARFGDMVECDAKGLRIPLRGRSLTRMIAQMFDAYDMAPSGHSSAI